MAVFFLVLHDVNASTENNTPIMRFTRFKKSIFYLFNNVITLHFIAFATIKQRLCEACNNIGNNHHNHDKCRAWDIDNGSE